MNRIAKFEKVSFEQFCASVNKLCDESSAEILRKWWEDIKLPTRATTGSAGYDFYAPFNFMIHEGKWITVPTGIRCRMEEGWTLVCLPKSGLGFKHGVKLRNTIGLIDAKVMYL